MTTATQWPRRVDGSLKSFGEMSYDETLTLWATCTEYPAVPCCFTCVNFEKTDMVRCGECQWSKKKKPTMFVWAGTHCKGYEKKAARNMANRKRLTRLCKIVQDGFESKKFFNPNWWNSCISGWAIESGVFSRDGLQRHGVGGSDEPTHKGLMGFAALQKFFDLSPKEAVYIFGQGQHTADDAIDRISEVLRHHERFWVWFPAKLGWYRTLTSTVVINVFILSAATATNKLMLFAILG